MADEVVRIHDAYYVLSSSTRLDDRTRVLKHGDTFALFDRFGDAEDIGTGLFGLYHQDTRYLSRLGLRVEGERPSFLSSTIREDDATLGVDLMNRRVRREEGEEVADGTLHLFRSKTVWDAMCFERLRIRNYGISAVDLTFTVDFDADFADIFELRVHRMPELFCGFPRRSGEAPTLYPMSCAPQAWAAGAPPQILQSCLGMEVGGAQDAIVFVDPHLPATLNEIRIDGLRVGTGSIDLSLVRHGPDVSVNVLRREGPVRVRVEK